jgi:hypothetical protein
MMSSKKSLLAGRVGEVVVPVQQVGGPEFSPQYGKKKKIN